SPTARRSSRARPPSSFRIGSSRRGACSAFSSSCRKGCSRSPVRSTRCGSSRSVLASRPSFRSRVRGRGRDRVAPVGRVEATSPDGRHWEVEAIREPFSFGEGLSRNTKVITVLLVAFTVFVAFLNLLFFIAFVIILLVWIAERVSNHLRPRFRART